MHMHDRIVVHVGDSGVRRDVADDLVDVPRGGDAGADVDDLPDTRLAHEKLYGRSQKCPVGQRGVPRLRRDLEQLAKGFPVRG